MITAAQLYSDDVSYMGFDLFEDQPELDVREFNVKKRAALVAVQEKLQRAQKLKPFVYKLIAGDTRVTLRKFRHPADFAFIDGGHSVETIMNDYTALSRCETIVLDDYYEADENGVCPDISKFGCNQLVAAMERHQYEILPDADPVKGGGKVKMVLIESN